MDITFTKNLYDADGDLWDESIYIHCGEDVSLRFLEMDDLDKFIEGVKKCRDEIASQCHLSTF